MRFIGFGFLVLLSLFGEVEAQTIGKHLHGLTDSKNKYVAFPLIVKSPEYKWGAGLAGIYYFKLRADSSTRTSNIKLVSFYTVRRQLVAASEGNVYFPGEQYILHYVSSVSKFPDKFWGIGNNTPSSALENYSISQVDVYPQLLREVREHLFFGVGYEFQSVFQFDYGKSQGPSLFDSENVLGRNGSKISGASVILSWDSRNNAFNPDRGFYFQYFVSSYNKTIGSDYDFFIHNADLRKYVRVGKNDIVAFQLNSVVTLRDVPIRNLANIGTNSYMRGYYEGRYQDKCLLASQVELRHSFSSRWGATVFGGAGKVAPVFADLWDFQSLKPSFGFGLRYALNPAEKLNLRVDAGFGKRSQGTYINMGEAF